MRTAPLEHLLRHERRIAVAGIGVLSILAWAYLVAGAGMGMSLGEMTTTALFPHAVLPAMSEAMSGGLAWSTSRALLLVAMWWVMMIAMMTPSAAPMILLHLRVARAARDKGQDPDGGLDQTAVFVAAYLLVWLAFSIVASGLQAALAAAGLIRPMTMWSASAPLSASLLIAAGVYQWTPLKRVCLSRCRSPMHFLVRHWRAGPSGALRLGALHGAYCVGCCWALMALLFVGGVMNPIWIVALTLVVLAEKLSRTGALVSHAGGALLVIWGLATLWA